MGSQCVCVCLSLLGVCRRVSLGITAAADREMSSSSSWVSTRQATSEVASMRFNSKVRHLYHLGSNHCCLSGGQDDGKLV